MTWSPISAGGSRDVKPHGPVGQGGRSPRDRNQPGRRAIPEGVKAGITAALIDGTMPKQEIAKAFGVGKDLVRRLAKAAAGVDRTLVATIERGLPAMLKVTTAQFTVAASEALERGDMGTATKAIFGAKLGTEATRWAAPAAESPGTTLQAFITALHHSGGGSLTVGPPPEPSDALPAPLAMETTAELIPPEPPEGPDAMPT